MVLGEQFQRFPPAVLFLSTLRPTLLLPLRRVLLAAPHLLSTFRCSASILSWSYSSWKMLSAFCWLLWSRSFIASLGLYGYELLALISGTPCRKSNALYHFVPFIAWSSSKITNIAWINICSLGLSDSWAPQQRKIFHSVFMWTMNLRHCTSNPSLYPQLKTTSSGFLGTKPLGSLLFFRLVGNKSINKLPS